MCFCQSRPTAARSCYQSGPFMLQSSDDSHTHRHTITCGRHTHTLQCSVKQHDQWHRQSASSPSGANPQECLTINVQWWKLKFRVRNYVIIFDNSGEGIGSMVRGLRHLTFGKMAQPSDVCTFEWRTNILWEDIIKKRNKFIPTWLHQGSKLTIIYLRQGEKIHDRGVHY